MNTNTFDEVFDDYMELKIFVDSDDNELKEKYYEASVNHNNKLLSDPEHYDAGFDVYLPELIRQTRGVLKVDHKIKCSAKLVKQFSGCKKHKRGTPFYTYARSSISKTSYRLSNNQGIIDAGYRGNIISAFDCISLLNSGDDQMEKYTRMIQICAPNLLPIFVEIVDKFDDLGCETSRGDGGFGSTGV
jgi:dUTPase